jgi:RHS repeat-associated protein
MIGCSPLPAPFVANENVSLDRGAYDGQQLPRRRSSLQQKRGNRNATSVSYALVNKNLAFSFGGYTAPLLDTTVTDALGHATQTLTSAQGRTLFSIDAEARQSTFEFDANGSLTQFRDPNATGYDCVYDERNRKLSCTDRRNATTSQAYDAQSNVITMTDGLNHSSHCVYDARNRKTSCTDRINGVTNYTYDANSNLATISDADAVAGNTGKQTVYTYDPRNLLATETYPDNGVKSFVYDGANRLVSRLDQKNDTVGYLYDFANRMTSRHYLDGQDDTFTFDAASRLLTAASARYNNVVTRTYDPASRLLSETQHINGVDYPVAYGYDAANRQTNVTYPDGKVLSRTFTNRDQLATAAFDGGNVLTRTYDIGMRQDQSTYGNSIVESRRYQNDNLIAQINTTANQVKLVYDLGDGYDANKRNTFAADFNLGVYEYAYDNEDRLTSNFDQGVGVTQTWVLSLVGDWNSFTKNAVTETRTHDAAHELLTRNATSLTYDQKGNLTQHSNGQQYTWDYENRMQTAVNALAVQVGVYTYDALGRRASKVTTAGITVFVSDGLQEIAEYDNAAAVNAPTREYVFGSYIDEPLMMLTAGARYYYHSDRLYSVQALTNAAGQIVERYRYDAYGNTTILAPNGTTVRASSIVGNPYMWQGGRLDAETGLYFKRARYYSADLGRFIGRDPIDVWGGLNLYEYCRGKPTNHFDPLGLEDDEEEEPAEPPPVPLPTTGPLTGRPIPSEYWWEIYRRREQLSNELSPREQRAMLEQWQRLNRIRAGEMTEEDVEEVGKAIGRARSLSDAKNPPPPENEAEPSEGRGLSIFELMNPKPSGPNPSQQPEPKSCPRPLQPGFIGPLTRAQTYAKLILSNQPWSWEQDFNGGEELSRGERSAIRNEALAQGLIPSVPYKAGTDVADFAAAGLVIRQDTLPPELWKATDKEQFDWLNARLHGGQPTGTTWHHDDTPGVMQLVPYGIHRVHGHSGGRSGRRWADAPRR